MHACMHAYVHIRTYTRTYIIHAYIQRSLQRRRLDKFGTHHNIVLVPALIPIICNFQSFHAPIRALGGCAHVKTRRVKLAVKYRLIVRFDELPARLRMKLHARLQNARVHLYSKKSICFALDTALLTAILPR